INAITQSDLRQMDAIGWTRVHGLDDHNQSNTGATTVLNDDVAGLDGNIELQGDHDWFKVTLVNTKHYVIKLDGKGGTDGLADPFLALYGGASPSRDSTIGTATTPTSLVATDNNKGVGNNALLSIGVNKGGTFFVDAGSFGAGV